MPPDPHAERAVSEPTGRTFTIRTWDDIVQVHRTLPEHRREPFIAELAQTLRYASATFDLAGLTSVKGEMRWTDDGDTTSREINLLAKGKPVLRFKMGANPLHPAEDRGESDRG